MSVQRDKGKGKERDIRPSVSTAIEEALATPISLSSSVDSSYQPLRSPISRPPQAHQAPPMRPIRPRLLSGLTRSTLPTASLTYASAGPRRRGASEGTPSQGESSTAWRSLSPVEMDQPFPDLDPETGMPTGAGRRGSSPSLHLQRTITGLLTAPSAETSSSLLPFNLPSVPNMSNTLSMPSMPSMSNLPSMPNLPGIPSMARFGMPSLPGRPSTERSGSQRNFSSTASTDDWGSWASGWWSGNKKKVDATLAEEDRADTIEEEQEKHRRKYRTPKNPIVFCHGLLGFDYLGPSSLPPLQISHWRGIREVLESNGAEVLMTRVAATGSIADRAARLEELISEKFPGREVNLVGHSMGGLDCRYLISQVQPRAFKPVTLTTISTPHRGSPFADYLIDNVIGRDRLPSLLSLLEAMRLPQSGDGSAFNALGTKSMRIFNSEVLDREDVKYYSWGASFDPGLLDTFRWPHSVILSKEGPNDGLVSVTSARWGEYRGTLLGVNHLDLVGWVNTVRYVFSEWTGNPIAFKPATFYLEVTTSLNRDIEVVYASGSWKLRCIGLMAKGLDAVTHHIHTKTMPSHPSTVGTDKVLARRNAGLENFSWIWRPHVFLRGGERASNEHASPFFEPLLSKDKGLKKLRTGSAAVDFVSNVLEELRIDKLWPAKLFEASGSIKRGNRHPLSTLVHGLVRFRYPELADQDCGLLNVLLKDAWPSVIDVMSDTSRHNARHLTAVEVTEAAESRYSSTLSDDEVQIAREVLTDWQKLVPPMSNEEMSRYLLFQDHESLTSWKTSFAREAFLATTGLRLRRYWYPVTPDRSGEHTQAEVTLLIALQRSFVLGQFLELADGALVSDAGSRSYRLSSDAGERLRLLTAFRRATGDSSVSFASMIERLAGPIKSNTERFSWDRFSAVFCCDFTTEDRDHFRARVSRLAEESSLEISSRATWSIEADLLLLKSVVETGRDWGFLARVLHEHAFHCSVGAVQSRLSKPGTRPALLLALYRLQVSAPRWWTAMELGDDPREVLQDLLPIADLENIPEQDLLRSVDEARRDGTLIIEEWAQRDELDGSLPETKLSSLQELEEYMLLNPVPAGASQVEADDKLRTFAAVMKKSAESVIGIALEATGLHELSL